MKTKLYLLLCTCIFTVCLHAQTRPVKQWDARFGGNSSDYFYSHQQTSDGGYILGGETQSGISGDKTEASRGGVDYWIVKTDSNGVKEWDVRFGGSSHDFFRSLQQTSDKGYILGGFSESGISGDKTQASNGGRDFWIVKIDSNGIKQWDASFGGSSNEDLELLKQTSDGGYILGGFSVSGISGDKTQALRGKVDYWIVKVNSNGVKEWDASFGGSEDDLLFSIHQTNDQGYILGGLSYSGISGDRTQASRGNADYWIVKVDSGGGKQWDAAFGGNSNDYMRSLKLTGDDGYVLGGISQSGISGEKTKASQGDWDYWVVKIDSSGQKQWDASFGGAGWDELGSLQQTSDGGYILGGYSNSGISGDKTQASRGGFDVWIVKTDDNGNKQWDASFGGNAGDDGDIQQTSDGGYILGGNSSSGVSGDKTQTSRGDVDYWMVKLAAGTTLPLKLPVFKSTINNTNAQLTWQTANEVNISHFNIQRSSNGVAFTTIDKTTAADTSNASQQYSYTDKDAFTGANVWYYRLEMVDKDGAKTYSSTLKLQKKLDNLQLSIYPNPVSNKLSLQINSDKKKDVQIEIAALDGKIISTKKISTGASSGSFEINVGNLSKGSYFLRYKTADEQGVVKFEKL